MCEKCKENQTEDIEEIELSKEQIQEILTEQKEEKVDVEEAIYYFDPLILNTDNLAEDIEFDKEEFNKGIKSASYCGGLYTGYVNSGMSNIDAFTLIMTEKQMELSVKIAEINSKTAIESSKHQSIMIEKNSL